MCLCSGPGYCHTLVLLWSQTGQQEVQTVLHFHSLEEQSGQHLHSPEEQTCLFLVILDHYFVHPLCPLLLSPNCPSGDHCYFLPLHWLNMLDLNADASITSAITSAIICSLSNPLMNPLHHSAFFPFLKEEWKEGICNVSCTFGYFQPCLTINAHSYYLKLNQPCKFKLNSKYHTQWISNGIKHHKGWV